jgi:hypothetical protein
MVESINYVVMSIRINERKYYGRVHTKRLRRPLEILYSTRKETEFGTEGTYTSREEAEAAAQKWVDEQLKNTIK